VRKTPPMPGAVEALTALSRLYRIVYLSARDEVLYEKTKAWLDDKGFPEGPVFCRDFHIGSRQEVFKQRFIAELKGHFPRVVVGEQTLANYRAQGIDTVHVLADAERPSGVASIVVDDEAGNCILIVPGANAGLSPDDVRRAAAAIQSADVVLCQLEVPVETTL